MSARQKLSRIRRPFSSNICRHSAAGSTVTRTRARSTSRSSSSPALDSAGSTRRRPSSSTTSLVPSPLTAYPSTSETSSSALRRVKSKRSRAGRGWPSSSEAAMSPSSPSSGTRVHSTPSLVACRPPNWPPATGNGMIRSPRPSRSTRVTGGACSPSSLAAAAPSLASLPPFASSGSPPAGRPARCGPNGDGVSAASVSRYGRAPVGNDRSNTWESYTGSKLRTDRKARCRPSAVKAGE